LIQIVLAVIAAALLAAGCAQRGTANIEPAYRPGGAGLLVASVTASGHNPGTLSFQIVRVSAPTETVVTIPVNDEALGLDWRLGDPDVQNGGHGRLAVVELEPGEYEVRRGFIHVSAQETYTSVRRHGFRFTIIPGKATYLGNVHVDMRHSPEGRLLAVTNLVDRRRRDLALLHKKYSGVRPEQVVFPDDIEHEAVLKRSAEGKPAKLEDLERLLPRK
jgi:hypothetical protein